ncbi:MAG: hypothetical protein ACOYJB_07860 [Christensenellaceae bacterium]|jgi:hypothetical protein
MPGWIHEHRKQISRIVVLIALIGLVLYIAFWFASSTFGGSIEGTGFVDEQRVITGSGNFDVDREDNIYFAAWNTQTIQIYDGHNNFLYAIDVSKDFATSGSSRIRILDDGTIEVFVVRPRIVLRYNKKGFLEERIEDEKYFSDGINNLPDIIEKNDAQYYLGSNIIYTVVKRVGDIETIIFEMPFSQIMNKITFAIGICSFVLLAVVNSFCHYVEKRKKI